MKSYSAPKLCLTSGTVRFVCRAVVCWKLLGCCPTAHADTQLIVPADRVDEAVYGAAANYDTYAQNRPEDLAYLKYIIELYRRRPNADPQLVIGQINEARSRFRDTYRRGDPSPPDQPGTGVPRYDWFNGAINIISTVPGIEIAALPLTAAREAKTLAETMYHRRMEPNYRLHSLLAQGLRIETERLDNHNAFTEAFRMAESNSRFAAAVEGALNRRFLNARDTFATNPDWASTPTAQAIQALMNQQGEIITSVEQLRELFGNELQHLHQTMHENLALVTDLAARQDVLYQYMLNAEQQRLDQERVAHEQEGYEKKVKAANASVYILSTLVGFNNPELGHQMQVVGNSTVQIADALHNFAKADALGSVILTGNMLGAVMSVVSLFSASGPTPDQQILEGIRQLQEMVHQLRVEMHERFDRVDAALNQLYYTMNERFDRIDTTLGFLRGDVEEIQQSLYNLESDLYRIERKVFAFLDAGFRRDLNETTNGYLGYRETYGQPIPWLSYIFAENKFHTWAINNARDEVSSGSAGRGYGDGSLYAELSSQPLESNLNYISQYTATKGWPAFTTARLANPRDWAIAANSWMELAGESPMFFRQVAISRLEQIYGVGLDLQQAVSNLTLVQGNPSPTANRALFNAVFANYKGKAAVFKQRLSEKEAEFRLAISTDAQKKEALRKLDLWGGAEQKTSYFPPVPPMVWYPGRYTSLALSQGIFTNVLELPSGWQQVIPTFCALAELTEMGSVRIGYAFGWSPTSQFPSCGQYAISIGGYLTGDRFMATVDDRDKSKIFDLFYSAGNNANPGSANGVWNKSLDALWNGGQLLSCGASSPTPVSPLKASYLSIASISVRSDDRKPELVAIIDEGLRELQRGSYKAVRSALIESGDSLQSAANELSGAKALLESVVTLGFPESLEQNDFIRALLFGSERLVDSDLASELCRLGITRSYDTNQNAKVDIAAILDLRITALETWVSNRLNQVETKGRAESLRLVSSTLGRLEAFRAVWSQPTPTPYIAPLGFRVTNGVPNRLFVVWGEPNLRYTVQFSSNLSQWADLPTSADEGTDFILVPPDPVGFYRAVLRP